MRESEKNEEKMRANKNKNHPYATVSSIAVDGNHTIT
jgi:hypothetical protein